MGGADMATNQQPTGKAKERPLIATGFLSDYGEAKVYADDGPTEIGVDPTYVPGFSDLKFQRDRELNEARQGKRPPRKVTTLPVNCRWAQRTDVKGAPTGRKITKHKKNGYRFATEADKGSDWLKELPDGAFVNAAGEIQMGEMVLMVCPSERAAANQYRQQKLTMDRCGASLQKAADMGMALEQTKVAPVALGSAVDVST